jgi:hypothetical protein
MDIHRTAQINAAHHTSQITKSQISRGIGSRYGNPRAEFHRKRPSLRRRQNERRPPTEAASARSQRIGDRLPV